MRRILHTVLSSSGLYRFPEGNSRGPVRANRCFDLTTKLLVDAGGVDPKQCAALHFQGFQPWVIVPVDSDPVLLRAANGVSDGETDGGGLFTQTRKQSACYATKRLLGISEHQNCSC